MSRKRQVLSGILRKEYLESFADMSARRNSPTLVGPSARLKSGVKLAGIVEEYKRGEPFEIELRQRALRRPFEPMAENRKPRETQEARCYVRAMMSEMMPSTSLGIELAPRRSPVCSVLVWRFHHQLAVEYFGDANLKAVMVERKADMSLTSAPHILCRVCCMISCLGRLLGPACEALERRCVMVIPLSSIDTTLDLPRLLALLWDQFGGY